VSLLIAKELTNENESICWAAARVVVVRSVATRDAHDSPQRSAAEPLTAIRLGSSGIAGVIRKCFLVDPSKAGFYSILLFVPPHTTIQGHSHRDDRMATVVSGAWYFGYGDRFDAKSLKKLPPEASTGAWRSQPLRAHRQGRCHRANLRVWSDRTRAISIHPTNRNPYIRAWHLHRVVRRRILIGTRHPGGPIPPPQTHEC